MSAPRSRIAAPLIGTAERAGRNRRSEDRIFCTDNAVILLDGASQPEASSKDGGWYADTLGRAIQDRLGTSPDDDLADLVAAAIEAVTDEHQLIAGTSPSATTAIVRWTDDLIEALVLGDSPVVVQTRSGDIHHVRDDRLRHVAGPQRRQLAAAPGFASAHPALWRELVQVEQSARNRAGGYWIAEADPQAARHAQYRRWERAAVAAVMMMSDGVSAGVDRYRMPADWLGAFRLAADSPARLVDLVHSVEASDPDGKRWRRSKRYDDKALAFIRF